jgi:hypothetical protein
MAEEEVHSKEWAAKIEELVRRAESLTNPEAKRVALELLRVVMEFHAAAVDRILEIVNEKDGGSSIIRSLAEDDLASSVLLLHDLHPDDFDTRVQRAVDKLRLRLNPRGADLALLGVEDGLVRLRYKVPRNGHLESVKALIEDTVLGMAPETSEVIIEGLEEPKGPDGFVPLATLFAGQT